MRAAGPTKAEPLGLKVDPELALRTPEGFTRRIITDEAHEATIVFEDGHRKITVVVADQESGLRGVTTVVVEGSSTIGTTEHGTIYRVDGIAAPEFVLVTERGDLELSLIAIGVDEADALSLLSAPLLSSP